MSKLKKAITHYSRAFWLAWLAKGVLPAIIKRFKRQPYNPVALLDKQLLSSAAVLAAFFAAFRQLEQHLPHLKRWNPAIAGFISSFVFILEKPEWRAPWAYYLGLRATLAALKGVMSERKYAEMNAGLFIISTAQLMYGVIVRPDAGDGLSGWLSMVGALPAKEAVESARKIAKDGDGDTCKCIHPSCGCLERVVTVYAQVFKITMPINMAISIMSGMRNGHAGGYLKLTNNT